MTNQRGFPCRRFLAIFPVWPFDSSLADDPDPFETVSRKAPSISPNPDQYYFFSGFTVAESPITDGTGNNLRDFEPKYDEKEGIDRSITNVLKLHLLAGGGINNKRNDVPGQVCLYQRGVGGMSESKFVRIMNMVLGDLTQQTKPMHKKLEKVYEKGDKLYIIGYSRGAASARQFVSELEQDGVVTASGEKVDKPPVEFLGCFETVSMQVKNNFINIMRRKKRGAITQSSVVGEMNGNLPSIVKKAVHNVALDDNRFRANQPFPPVFMDSKDDRVHEAWFPGEHGDVGGTYYTEGVPDVSCKYMQEWMENLEDGITFIEAKDIHPECLEIDEHPEANIDKTKLDIKPDPSDKLHLGKSQVENPSYRPVVTVTNEEIIEGGTVRIHRSVLDHFEAMEEKKTPYAINPEIKKANIVVVGSLDKELDAETKRLKELLKP